jgi:hypothetical protein
MRFLVLDSSMFLWSTDEREGLAAVEPVTVKDLLKVTHSGAALLLEK